MMQIQNLARRGWCRVERACRELSATGPSARAAGLQQDSYEDLNQSEPGFLEIFERTVHSQAFALTDIEKGPPPLLFREQ